MDVRNDEPIKDIFEDELGFRFQAIKIASLVASEHSLNHLAVGISGSWGTGKTSLLNMIKYVLERKIDINYYRECEAKIKKGVFEKLPKKEQKTVRFMIETNKEYISKLERESVLEFATILDDAKVVWFDPWFFGSEDNIIKAFFYRLAKEVSSEDKVLSNLFIKLACIMRNKLNLPENLPVVGDTFKLINIGNGLFDWFSSILAGDIYGKNLMDFNDIKQKINDRLKVKKISNRNDEDEVVLANRKRIILIIDDLDRLQRNEALTILKLIRLLTEFENINIIVGFDEEVLGNMIKQECVDGKDYLRKIINFPLYIPKINTNLLDLYLLNNLWTNELKKSIVVNYGCEIHNMPIIQSLFSKIKTLRDAKRFINTYRFGLSAVFSRVNPIDYLGLCMLYFFYTDIFNGIKDRNSNYFEKLPIRRINVVGSNSTSVSEQYVLKSVLVDNIDDEDLKNILETLYPIKQTDSYEKEYFIEEYPFNYSNSISWLHQEYSYFGLMPGNSDGMSLPVKDHSTGGFTVYSSLNTIKKIRNPGTNLPNMLP